MLPREIQRFHVKPESIALGDAEDRLRRVRGEALESALRVGNARERDACTARLNTLLIRSRTAGGAPSTREPGRGARRDHDVGAGIEARHHGVEAFDRQRQVRVDEHQPIAARSANPRRTE